MFLVLGILVRYSFLQNLDLRFTREVQEHSDPLRDRLMMMFTFLGNGMTLIIGAVLVAAGLAAYHRRSAALFVLISLIGLPIDIGLKEIWARARPDAALVNVVVRYSGTSFPSGHSLGSTMVYGTLAALAYMHLPKSLWRTLATVALAAIPLLVAWSRVYLGAHWFSDVVGGITIGLAVLIPLVKGYAEHIKERVAPTAPSQS